MKNTTEAQMVISEINANYEKRRAIRADAKKAGKTAVNDCPLVISFAGRFKTGKSSLINAILGMELLPTKATTATTVVTRIVRGSKQRAWLLKKGIKTEISVSKAKSIILEQKINDINDLVEVIVEVPIKWLPSNVEIRDTPGMDDSAQNGLLEEVTMRSLQNSDVCVCVYDAQSFISGKEKERTVRINRFLGGNTVYVINCINRLTSQKDMDNVKSMADVVFKKMEKYIWRVHCPETVILTALMCGLKLFLATEPTRTPYERT